MMNSGNAAGAPGRSRRQRRRLGRRLGAAGAAALAALIALPAAWGGSADAAARAASCPWVTSTAPIDQRVAQLMSHMTLADKITLVEGHGTTNPYVFYTPAVPALCIPAVGLEDGPAGVA